MILDTFLNLRAFGVRAEQAATVLAKSLAEEETVRQAELLLHSSKQALHETHSKAQEEMEQYVLCDSL